MKKISVIGIGKLGLCFSLSLEKAGFHVLGVDIRKDYVESINNKTFQSDEQHVNEYLSNSSKFLASTRIKDAVKYSDIIFVVVATPSLPNGRYDHKQIEKVIKKLISFGPCEKTKHLIINCTTMPQYCAEVQRRLKDYNYVVSYNPEFIAQGTIIQNQENPDMVLIGEGNKEAGDLIQSIYEKMVKNSPKYCRMSTTEAELCKISLNCFLTTKIAYTNMIGDIAVAAGCRPQIILDAVAQDTRVGIKLTKYGFGYGGPCLPRDNRVLAIFAKDMNRKALISLATDKSNNQHLLTQVEDYIRINGYKDYTIESISYKPESNMLEESQQLAFVKLLTERGIKVKIVERQNMIEQVKSLYGDRFEYEIRK